MRTRTFSGFEVTFPKFPKEFQERNTHKNPHTIMRLLKGILLLITVTIVSAASWSFEAGSITVASKGTSEASFNDQ